MAHYVRRRSIALILGATIALPGYAVAHDGGPVAPQAIAGAWSWEPLVAIGVVVLAAAYALGARARSKRSRRPIDAVRAYCFLGGVTTLALALLSPVAALGETLFAGHMVQHVLLTMVAAPLVVAADVGTMLLWALPTRGRRAVSPAVRALRPLWSAVTLPVVAWTLHLGTLVFWHWSVAYEAAVRSHALHTTEHVSFLATAVPFWWNLVAPMRRQRLGLGSALFYLFAASMVGALLGALIAMAREPWYLVHARGALLWGLTPLEDQQLAGLIMWVPAGLVYLVALVVVALPALRRREPLAA